MRGDTATTAADIFSLGIVLYRTLTGEHPFDIDGLTLPALIAAASNDPPITASARLGGVAADRLEALAADRRTSGPKLIRRLRGDLGPARPRAGRRRGGSRLLHPSARPADRLRRGLDHR